MTTSTSSTTVAKSTTTEPPKAGLPSQRQEWREFPVKKAQVAVPWAPEKPSGRKSLGGTRVSDLSPKTAPALKAASAKAGSVMQSKKKRESTSGAAKKETAPAGKKMPAGSPPPAKQPQDEGKEEEDMFPAFPLPKSSRLDHGSSTGLFPRSKSPVQDGLTERANDNEVLEDRLLQKIADRRSENSSPDSLVDFEKMSLHTSSEEEGDAEELFLASPRGKQMEAGLTGNFTVRHAAKVPPLALSLLPQQPLDEAKEEEEPPFVIFRPAGAPKPLLLQQVEQESAVFQKHKRLQSHYVGQPLAVTTVNTQFPKPFQEFPRVFADPGMSVDFPMESFNPSPEQIEGLKASMDAKALEFNRSWVTEDQLRALTKTFPAVVKATLFYCPEVRKAAVLGDLKQLALLSLSSCMNLEADPFQGIGEEAFQNLEMLQLYNLSISGEGLSALPVMKKLRWLDISFCKNLDDSSFVRLLKHPVLMMIVVTGASISQEAIDHVKRQRRGLQIEGAPAARAETWMLQGDEGKPASSPFLRNFLLKKRNNGVWKDMKEVASDRDLAGAVALFYQREFEKRGLAVQSPASTVDTMFEAEEELKQADRMHLATIFQYLLEQLQKTGYFIGEAPDTWEILWFLMSNLDALKKIRELKFDEIGLEMIPPSFSEVNWCMGEHLSFAKNKLTSFPYFPQTPSLRTLDLQGNQITELRPEPFLFWRGINVVILTDNRIRELPKALGISSSHGANAVILQLANNQISRIPDELILDLAAADPIQFYLDLSGNPIDRKGIPAKMPKNIHLLLESNRLDDRKEAVQA